MSARTARALLGTVVVMSLAACGGPAGSTSEQATRTAPSTSSPASSTASAPIDVAAARKALQSPHVPIDRSLFRLDPKYPPSDNLSSSVGVCDGTVSSDGTRLIMHGEFYTSPAPESATVSVIRTMYSSTENRDSALADARRAPKVCATLRFDGNVRRIHLSPSPQSLPARTVTLEGTGTRSGSPAWSSYIFVVPAAERSLTYVEYAGRGSARDVLRLAAAEAAAANAAARKAEAFIPVG